MRFSPLSILPLLLLATSTSASGIPPNRLQARQAEPSPTGRGACILQGESWTCEVAANGVAPSTPTSTPAPATDPVAEPAPVAESEPEAAPEGCHYHGTELHCGEEEEPGSNAGHDHSGHSHAGHR